MPQVLQTDNAQEFSHDGLIGLLCKQRGVRHVRTRTYSPNENGVVERLNKTLKEDLRQACTTKACVAIKNGIMEACNTPAQVRKYWVELLPDVTMAYNYREHSALGMSPFEAHRFRKPPVRQLLMAMAEAEAEAVAYTTADPKCVTTPEEGTVCPVVDPKGMEGGAAGDGPPDDPTAVAAQLQGLTVRDQTTRAVRAARAKAQEKTLQNAQKRRCQARGRSSKHDTLTFKDKKGKTRKIHVPLHVGDTVRVSYKFLDTYYRRQLENPKATRPSDPYGQGLLWSKDLYKITRMWHLRWETRDGANRVVRHRVLNDRDWKGQDYQYTVRAIQPKKMKGEWNPKNDDGKRCGVYEPGPPVDGQVCGAPGETFVPGGPEWEWKGTEDITGRLTRWDLLLVQGPVLMTGDAAAHDEEFDDDGAEGGPVESNDLPNEPFNLDATIDGFIQVRKSATTLRDLTKHVLHAMNLPDDEEVKKLARASIEERVQQKWRAFQAKEGRQTRQSTRNKEPTIYEANGALWGVEDDRDAPDGKRVVAHCTADRNGVLGCKPLRNDDDIPATLGERQEVVGSRGKWKLKKP